jgi:hypothetical protein
MDSKPPQTLTKLYKYPVKIRARKNKRKKEKKGKKKNIIRNLSVKV